MADIIPDNGNKEESKKEDSLVGVILKDALERNGQKMKKGEFEKLLALFEEMFDKGISPKKALNLTDTSLEFLYSQAFRQYNSGHYKQAGYIFQVLNALDPTNSRYFYGKGACFHMLKDYDSACMMYLMAGQLDQEDPIPYYHMIDCYQHMKDIGAALHAANRTLERSHGKSQFEIIEERVTLIRDTLLADLEKEKKTVKS